MQLQIELTFTLLVIKLTKNTSLVSRIKLEQKSRASSNREMGQPRNPFV